MRSLATFAAIVLLSTIVAMAGDDDTLFRERVASVFERRCLSCHNDADRKGGLSLQGLKQTRDGGESGSVIAPAQPDQSLLLMQISGDKPEMPKNAKPLAAADVAAIRQWIANGAKWPDGVELREKPAADLNWWSLRPMTRAELPKLGDEDARRVRSPIDAFVLSKLRQQGLAPSPEADRRTLIRRLYFDLIGLPPTPEEIDAFASDADPRAYDKLLDRLLDSPHYGERWARHWLDVVHYADTHGYDKDKLRPNAWPYRDYVIRSLNADKPYARFVEEQLAGDVLYPETADGNLALGFISAGPWDFVGHAEVPESKIDGQIARLLDRDDMVVTAMNTFCSLTAQCARCHNHKFDPISMEDYYSLQAVFAALDRADRAYDADPGVAQRRSELQRRAHESAEQRKSLDTKIQQLAGPELTSVDQRIVELTKVAAGGEKAEFGYHSAIVPRAEDVKWVQVDLGRSQPIDYLVYVGCHDAFNNIGAGFGFPVRYKIEISDDDKFATGVTIVEDQTQADVPNPGVKPQSVKVGGREARFVRVTATKLALRQNDYIFALAELSVLKADGQNVAAGGTVTALDSIEAPVRWQRNNLVDGYFYGAKEGTTVELVRLNDRRRDILDKSLDPATKQQLAALTVGMQATEKELAALPPKQLVYAGTVHHGSGAFSGTGPTGGKPRDIRVLQRGDVRNPGQPVGPGTVSIIAGVDDRFHVKPDQAEGLRRAALAKWVVDQNNPLTWRSIVNRVWQYHFGRAIVDSPNDFGRMGQLPTHPELLDWLAVEFRDGSAEPEVRNAERGVRSAEQDSSRSLPVPHSALGAPRSPGSLKSLHRLICGSATYRQASAVRDDFAQVDAGNQYLWRMNRRRLDAEALRDSALAAAGKLDRSMFGPGYWDFVLEKPENSPHFEYDKQNPDDPKTHRRSIYRFIVRSAPDPFMETLDCADPSLLVDKRNETINALSALALLNNKFMVRMSEHFATRVESLAADTPARVTAAFRIATGRPPTDMERAELIIYAKQFGLPNTCRLILNLNEFAFVD